MMHWFLQIQKSLITLPPVAASVARLAHNSDRILYPDSSSLWWEERYSESLTLLEQAVPVGEPKWI